MCLIRTLSLEDRKPPRGHYNNNVTHPKEDI